MDHLISCLVGFVAGLATFVLLQSLADSLPYTLLETRLWSYIVGRTPEVGSHWRDRYGFVWIIRGIGYDREVYASLDNAGGPIPQPKSCFLRRDFHLTFRRA
jgi:hypothetical protein